MTVPAHRPTDLPHPECPPWCDGDHDPGPGQLEAGRHQGLHGTVPAVLRETEEEFLATAELDLYLLRDPALGEDLVVLSSDTAGLLTELSAGTAARLGAALTDAAARLRATARADGGAPTG